MNKLVTKTYVNVLCTNLHRAIVVLLLFVGLTQNICSPTPSGRTVIRQMTSDGACMPSQNNIGQTYTQAPYCTTCAIDRSMHLKLWFPTRVCQPCIEIIAPFPEPSSKGRRDKCDGYAAVSALLTDPHPRHPCTTAYGLCCNVRSP